MLIGMKAGRIIPANQSVMNSEQGDLRIHGFGWARYFWVFIGIAMGLTVAPNLAASSAPLSHLDAGAQDAKGAIDADFSSAVAAMAGSDPSDAAVIEKSEKRALGILDGLVISALSGSGRPDLDTLNARLATLVSQEHGYGEAYRVIRLGGKPLIFTLVADFGLGSPSAIRLYAEQESPARFALAGEIDRFTQKDLFDDSLDLQPLPLPDLAPGVVFVTVAGRTDQLQTGMFTAWRFDGKQLTQLWTTDLISHSTFEIAGDNFILTYCHEPADQDLKTCPSMVREKYAYSIPDGKWRLVSAEPATNPKD